jgi:hypothetical protein
MRRNRAGRKWKAPKVTKSTTPVNSKPTSYTALDFRRKSARKARPSATYSLSLTCHWREILFSLIFLLLKDPCLVCSSRSPDDIEILGIEDENVVLPELEEDT